MKKIFAAVAILLTTLVPDVALGVAQRTFVASDGSDTYPCTRVQPCRSFATAIGKTADKGEIIVLDSAGYGPFTIAKSVSIIAPAGIYAGIAVGAGTGIIATGLGISVVLRGLSINGVGGSGGIDFLEGAELTIEGCEISNMTNNGILIRGTDSRAVIQNTTLRDNGETAVVASPTAGTLRVAIANSTLVNNGTGVDASADNGDVAVTVARSTVTGHSIAFFVGSSFGHTSSILLDGDTITFNNSVFVTGGTNSTVFSPGNNTIGYFGAPVGTLTPCCAY